MIDQATIDRIIDAAQIVDVVSDFVTLKRRGVNFVGLCPFHDDKTPSFSVSPSKGLCKCFSCNKGGNAVHFIMEHEQLSYHDALRYLAKKYSIEVKERELTSQEKEVQSLRESMFITNSFANDYFQHTLHNHADGKAIGMVYFRQRGFRDDTIKKFQLGYSTDQWDALSQAAKQKGFKSEYLIKTGVCYSTDDGRIRDRFRGRVIFPVHTLSGKVVAFGGRILKSDVKTAKYVNSPESEIYHKSNELYGIYFAKQAIIKQDRCFLVEGYTDVISMHQAGVENVVSSSGTALTPGQIRLIHRFTANITVLYDGDMAGIKASIRGIDMLLEAGMNIKVLLLPDGEDPDSFARKHNASEFQAYIEAHQTDFISFKTKLLVEDAGKDPIKRAELITDIVKSISVIPDAIVRTVYIGECSRLLQIEEKVLDTEVTKRVKQQAEKMFERPATAESTPQSEAAIDPAIFPPEVSTDQSFMPQEGKEQRVAFHSKERLIIRELVRYGEKEICKITNKEGIEQVVTVAEYIDTQLKVDDFLFDNPIHRTMLAEATQRIHQEGFTTERYFLTHPSVEISRLAAELVNDRFQLCKSQAQSHTRDEDRLYELVSHLIYDFKNSHIKEEIKQLERTLQNPAIMQDDNYKEIMNRYMMRCKVRNYLAKNLGDRILNV